MPQHSAKMCKRCESRVNFSLRLIFIFLEANFKRKLTHYVPQRLCRLGSLEVTPLLLQEWGILAMGSLSDPKKDLGYLTMITLERSTIT